ncbi:glycosyl hydrolase [Haloferula sp. A504]|uniref:glycosyl hydrolase n=1 Tax=Haloferula sp. A504 TaxID=3373601 RepID=UPI0031CBAE6E|nr:hypothetical protein [Verrucomicrobiaceae bacterium E54]
MAHGELSESEFRDPPLAARPSALWSWMNGHVDHGQITHELEEMKAKGMRGAIIWDIGVLIDPEKIIPAGPAFLGPESLASIHHAMDEAERLGLELGLFASSSWNAGGDWIEAEDGSKALRWSEVKAEGPSRFSGVLPLPEGIVAEKREVAVVAVREGEPDRIRLDDRLGAEGTLEWEVPEGSWRILRFVSGNTGERLNCPSENSDGRVIDHLSREATDAHFKHMLDALARGRDGYGPLKVLMLDSYEVRPVTDWTPDFVEEFTERYGYDPVPWLPVLAGVTVGEGDLGDRFLHDYRKLVSDLLVEDHFARARELLHERGLLLLAEGGHGGHARVDPLKALGAADIPMGEFWNHRKNWVTKEAASAAHIYGKTLVNAESFTGWQHWQDGPATYKRLFDIALCAGLNQVSFHTFAHQPPGSGLPGVAYHAGEHFNVNQSWWDVAGPMLADMSRSCHLLQQGQFVADVAVYYGDNAPNLVPPRRIAPTVKPRWGEGYCLHCGKPEPVDLSSLGYGHDYDYVNEEVILERMRVEDGRIVLPDGMNYRLLVLPDREAISPAVLRKIGALVEAGATVVGPKPERSNSLSGYPECDAGVREGAGRIWGDCDGETVKRHRFGKGEVVWNVPLDEVLAGMKVRPDFEVEDFDNSGREIDYIHRETAVEDIYLVANTTLEPQRFAARFRVQADRVPSFWRAEDGTVAPCFHYEVGDGFVRMPLDLAPASSIFVVFAEGAARDHCVQIEGPDGGIEITGLEGAELKARVREGGTYRFKTAQGRNGEMVVGDVPPDRGLTGPWTLSFPPDRGAPASVELAKLIDWTSSEDPGVRYFSGTATYQTVVPLTAADLSTPGPIFLDLGEVKEVARVSSTRAWQGVF